MSCYYRRVFLIVLFCFSSGSTQPGTAAANDSLNASLLLAHLRNHFDDIHDVSMRFHHRDHRIAGLIALRMFWQQERMDSVEVVQNETGDKEFPSELIKKLQTWRVTGLQGPFTMTLPLRIKLVGSDDSDFPNKAILTGQVYDADSVPVQDAVIRFLPGEEGLGMVPPARSNSEGIFVRTLIPPGVWTLQCEREGYCTIRLEKIVLHPGEHARRTCILQRQ